jgi:hypothetical protein
MPDARRRDEPMGMAAFLGFLSVRIPLTQIEVGWL